MLWSNFFRLGNNVKNKRLLFLIFLFFSLEDALNVLSSFLSDFACVSHWVDWGLWFHTSGKRKKSRRLKKMKCLSATSSSRPISKWFYELGQTTGGVWGFLTWSSLSGLLHKWDRPLGLFMRGEQINKTDHLWMCGMSSIPLFPCCIDSFFRSRLTYRRRVCYWLCGSVLENFTWFAGADKGVLFSSRCKIVLFQSFATSLIYGCFWNEMQNRNSTGWIFVVFLVRVLWWEPKNWTALARDSSSASLGNVLLCLCCGASKVSAFP